MGWSSRPIFKGAPRGILKALYGRSNLVVTFTRSQVKYLLARPEPTNIGHYSRAKLLALHTSLTYITASIFTVQGVYSQGSLGACSFERKRYKLKSGLKRTSLLWKSLNYDPQKFVITWFWTN